MTFICITFRLTIQIIKKVFWSVFFCSELTEEELSTEVIKFSITLDIKTLECQCGIDPSDPQSCLTAWTDCRPLETQTGSLARQQNSLQRPNWIGGFLLFKAHRTKSELYYLTGKHPTETAALNLLKSLLLAPTGSGRPTFVTFRQTAVKREWKYSPGSHWHAATSCCPVHRVDMAGCQQA